MNLGTIRTLVKTRVGGSSRSDLDTGDGLINLDHAINSAYREIAFTFRFHQLERTDTSKSTVASQAYVEEPDNMYAFLTVYDATNKQYLDPLPGGWEEYERRGVINSTSTGKPKEWVHFDNRLYLKPLPADIYSLRLGVLEEVSELTDPSDSPVIPKVWHDAIVILATRNMWRILDEEERALAVEGGEFVTFSNRVRTPRAREQHVTRRRGLRVNRGIRDPQRGL